MNLMIINFLVWFAKQPQSHWIQITYLCLQPFHFTLSCFSVQWQWQTIIYIRTRWLKWLKDKSVQRALGSEAFDTCQPYHYHLDRCVACGCLWTGWTFTPQSQSVSLSVSLSGRVHNYLFYDGVTDSQRIGSFGDYLTMSNIINLILLWPQYNK